MRETLQWLDDATSRFPHVVTLQGPEDVYEHWSEVEKFVVPRTLFSEDDGLDQADEPEIEAADEDMSKLTLGDGPQRTSVSSMASNASRSVSPSSSKSQHSSVSALSPPTSPIKANSSPAKAVQPEYSASSSASVPLRLQPMFNYILWRIHQEANPIAALESFIFLCNDQSKVNYAKGFEIRTKRLEQLREAVGREDRDFKNRQMVMSKENQTVQAAPTNPKSKDDGNDEVVYKPPPRAPAAMWPEENQSAQLNVMDPDAFGRNTETSGIMQPPKGPPRSPRAHHASPRGGAQLPFSPRGSPRGNFRGGVRGRGGNFSRGGQLQPPNRTEAVAPGPQIDPNSFVRPRGSGHTGQGGRKLWVPS